MASAPQARFDLALLQVAKQTADSTVSESELNLVPQKVKKALEAALSEILRKPAEELNRTVSQPRQLSALVTQVAGEQGLDLEGHKQLDALVQMAAPRVKEAVFQGRLATPVMHSGPQGGTTESLPEAQISQAPAPQAEELGDDARAQSLLATPAALQAPAVVSTRTQDATEPGQAPSPLAGQASAQVRTAAAERPVEQVTLLRQPQAEAMPQAPSQQPQPQQRAAVQAPAVLAVQAQPPQPRSQGPAVTPRQAQAQPPQPPQAEMELPVIVERNTVPARQETPQRLEVTVVRNEAPAPIQEGSEIVLAPQPQRAAASSPAPQPAPSQPVQASSPAPQAQAQAAALLQPEAPQADLPEAASAPEPEAQDAAPRRVSPVMRWLSEQGERVAMASSHGLAGQGSTVLNQGLRGLAENLAREYALRESVFEQAITAIEDAAQEMNQLRIKLRPESLGELDVTLSVEDGKLTARLVAGNAEVRDVFAAHLQQFKQSLESIGLSVSQLSVAVRAETGSQGQGQQAFQQPSGFFPRDSRREEAPAQLWPQQAAPEGNPSRFSALA